ncbi:hypothetical protein RND81_05G107800 [Saponaria officinalis]|uniref:Two-component response regulator-like APRR5 n=1 Tax=Saponaria officinalis TaxID=3572 RepID=A0AAW1KZV1_SAPOF
MVRSGIEVGVDKKESKEGSSSMVRWENFLPKTSLRVLLVEADDSTRQIIGALLRKCNYKVATAPDGLKAWEVLKSRPHNIDLILTEMELPSISGYALLTLIMEHDICKNIPVIMMSKYDSVSMVYKCMTKGATDFLVKPIRINELKNLWQHVWRRQSRVIGGAQEKLEATAENDTASDHSSGSKACTPIRDDCLKKGSDAQSSCGKRDLEAESSYTAEAEDNSHPKQGSSPVAESRVQERLVFGHSGQNLSTPESAAADTAEYIGNSTLDRQKRLEQNNYSENLELCTQASASTNVVTNSPREAIDLIGAFDNHSKRLSYSNDGVNRYDSSPQLDLSLTRSPLAGLENKIGNENQMLTRSNTSAFSRYINTKVHLTFDNNGPESNSSAKESLPQYGRKVASVSIPVNLTEDAQHENGDVSQKLFSIPVSMGGVRVDMASPSANSANPQMNSYHQFSADMINRHNYNILDHSPRISSSEPVGRQEQKRESLEDQARFFVPDQCASSSVCDDTARRLNGTETGNEQTHGAHDLKRQRSLQREAALNKFRLKRKERCYEKKVRYESRKKLAEQRPRVKGQFVRQVPPDPPPPKSHHSNDSLTAN